MATKKPASKKNGRNKGLIQGTYEVQNKDKYVGKKDPRFLSSYELQTFRWMDFHESIIEWGAECVIVPYYNPVKQRKARYIVDVYCKYVDKNGNTKTRIVEIKPYNQTLPPVEGKRKRKDVFENEQMTYLQNVAKWEAATKYAEERGWEFKVITEYNIFRK